MFVKVVNKNGLHCNIKVDCVTKCNTRVEIHKYCIAIFSKFKDTEGKFYNTPGFLTPTEDYILDALNTTPDELYYNREEYEDLLNNHINAILCESLNSRKFNGFETNIDEYLFFTVIEKLKVENLNVR